MKQKMFIVLAALLTSAVLLTSCGEKAVLPEPATLADPIEKMPETEDTTDYEALSSLPFEALAESAEADFTVEATAGGVRVTAYTGSDTKVRIPERIGGQAVVAIADDAFQNQSKWTVLFIPDTVTEFGKNILVGCSQLYALRTPLPTKEGTAFLGYLFGAEIYEKNNMPDLRNLEFLELGGSLAALPQFALYDCNDLVTVKLPDTVTKLEPYSLYRCESLKYLQADALTEVETFAMAQCSSITDLSFSASVQRIGLGALENCHSLRNLTLPFVGGSKTENTYLGYLFGATEPAFSQALYPPVLRRVTVLESGSNVGDYAFYRCESLWEAVFLGGFESVGVRAFSGCVRLQKLALPNNVTTIREHAFSGCISMLDLTLGTALQTVGVGAFSDCSALTELALPQTLKALPNACFSGCGRLNKINLGGVSEVGKNAFHRCTSLASVTTAQAPKLADGNDALKRALEA